MLAAGTSFFNVVDESSSDYEVASRRFGTILKHASSDHRTPDGSE